jgi:hypothetical protein
MGRSILDVTDEEIREEYGVDHPTVIAGLRRWVSDGIPPGSFLLAVLENDLQMALIGADASWTRESLEGLVQAIRSLTPRECHGSEAKVEAWADKHLQRRVTEAKERRWGFK